MITFKQWMENLGNPATPPNAAAVEPDKIVVTLGSFAQSSNPYQKGIVQRGGEDALKGYSSAFRHAMGNAAPEQSYNSVNFDQLLARKQDFEVTATLKNDNNAEARARQKIDSDIRNMRKIKDHGYNTKHMKLSRTQQLSNGQVSLIFRVPYEGSNNE